MNFDEIANHVYGIPESIDALLNALASVGVEEKGVKFTIGKYFATVPITVGATEKLFKYLLSKQFYTFKHS